MNVDIEILPVGAISVINSSVGEKIATLNLSGYEPGQPGFKTDEAAWKQVLVPVYPVTSELLQAIANMLDYAKKNDLQSFRIVVSGTDVGVIAR